MKLGLLFDWILLSAKISHVLIIHNDTVKVDLTIVLLKTKKS